MVDRARLQSVQLEEAAVDGHVADVVEGLGGGPAHRQTHRRPLLDSVGLLRRVRVVRPRQLGSVTDSQALGRCRGRGGGGTQVSQGDEEAEMEADMGSTSCRLHMNECRHVIKSQYRTQIQTLAQFPGHL